ncbi:MAG: DUF2256 domain-containing protein [Halothiobacillaceae bacterium]
MKKRRSNDKAELPRKLCPVCGRPFVWRKKWARDWAAVKYCSDACRRKAKGLHKIPSKEGDA